MHAHTEYVWMKNIFFRSFVVVGATKTHVHSCSDCVQLWISNFRDSRISGLVVLSLSLFKWIDRTRNWCDNNDQEDKAKKRRKFCFFVNSCHNKRQMWCELLAAILRAAPTTINDTSFFIRSIAPAQPKEIQKRNSTHNLPFAVVLQWCREQHITSATPFFPRTKIKNIFRLQRTTEEDRPKCQATWTISFLFFFSCCCW